MSVYRRALCGPEGLTGKYARVAERLPVGSTVLEIGCSSGYFSQALMARGHRVVGLERDPEAARLAQQVGVPVVVGDSEDPTVLHGLADTYDVILLMDVLEHLRDPRQALEMLKRVQHAATRVLITGPNVAYWAIRKELMLGRWCYTDAGILDRTHLRFFTAETWRQLLASAGYTVVALHPAEGMLPLEGHLARLVPTPAALDSLRRGALAIAPRLFSVVFLIEASAQRGVQGQPRPSP